MTHRLLAVLTDPATVSACLDAAALAAPALPGCQIEALHVDVDPDHIMASPEEIDFQQLREKREGTPAERTRASCGNRDSASVGIPPAAAKQAA